VLVAPLDRCANCLVAPSWRWVIKLKPGPDPCRHLVSFPL
jgi:hypothetical protein